MNKKIVRFGAFLFVVLSGSTLKAQITQTVTSSIGSNLAGQPARGSDVIGSVSFSTATGGGTFSTGWFTGTADFNPDAGASFTLTAGANNGMYVQKLNEEGQFQWAVAVKANAGSSIESSSICYDQYGTSLYLTGKYSGTINFNTGAGSNNLTAVGSTDVYVLKISTTDGSFIWVKSLGGSTEDVGTSIITQGSSVYVTGTFTGSADFDPGAGSTTLTSAGLTDVFITRISTNGGLIWSKKVGGAEQDYSSSIISDETGVVLVGSYQGEVDFDPNGGVTNVTALGSFGDAGFCLRLNSNGTLAWVRNISPVDGPTIGTANLNDIVKFNNDYYLCGYMAGTLIMSTADGRNVGGTPNNYDGGIVMKLDANGYPVWIKFIDNPPGAQQAFENPTSIGVAIQSANGTIGALYIAGFALGTVDYDPNGTVASFNSSNDYFITRWDTDGNFDWFNILQSCNSTWPKIYVHHVHPSWSAVYMTGEFNQTQDFDFSPANINSRTSLQDMDAFTVKWLDTM